MLSDVEADFVVHRSTLSNVKCLDATPFLFSIFVFNHDHVVLEEKRIGIASRTTMYPPNLGFGHMANYQGLTKVGE